MHGLVHAKTLDVRPLQDTGALAGHLFGIVQSGEFYKLCFGQWFSALDQFAQGKSNPGDNDRPALDAAMAVDALFRSCHFYDCVDVEYLLSLDVAIDGHCPGTSPEIFCEVGGAVFLGGGC